VADHQCERALGRSDVVECLGGELGQPDAEPDVGWVGLDQHRASRGEGRPCVIAQGAEREGEVARTEHCHRPKRSVDPHHAGEHTSRFLHREAQVVTLLRDVAVEPQLLHHPGDLSFKPYPAQACLLVGQLDELFSVGLEFVCDVVEPRAADSR